MNIKKSKIFDLYFNKNVSSSENAKPKEFKQPPPIIYTVENKNGIYRYSTLDKIAVTTLLIRITVLEKGENENNYVKEIVKQMLIKGEDIIFDSWFSANADPPKLMDMPICKSLSNPDDLKFELIENSKIEVTLFPEWVK